MGSLVLQHLDIRYGNTAVVKGLDLRIDDGQMVSLLGPSGAGKTTILKAVAGLMTPTGGDIRINGRSALSIPPEKRDAVMVFQKPLLFPFMTVAQNIAFGLKMRGALKPDRGRKIKEILRLTKLSGLENRKPHQLSGGQQQRVSLARALVLKPAILLLDEPLSNLDANLRQEMRELILDIQTETKITTLFVTHDQSEALMLSHKVGLILNGRLRQFGTPHELFHRPIDADVARFFGGANFFEGMANNGNFISEFITIPMKQSAAPERKLTATIRPEDIAICANGHLKNGARIDGVVRRTSFEGINTRIWVDTPYASFVVLSSETGFHPGQHVHLSFSANKVRIFPPATDE